MDAVGLRTGARMELQLGEARQSLLQLDSLAGEEEVNITARVTGAAGQAGAGWATVRLDKLSRVANIY